MVSITLSRTYGAHQRTHRRRSGRRRTCEDPDCASHTNKYSTPYSDYRGLKKRITAIRKAQQGEHYSASPDDSPGHNITPHPTPRQSFESSPPGPVKEERLSPQNAEKSHRRNTIASYDSQAFTSAVQETARVGASRSRNSFIYRPAKSLSSRRMSLLPIRFVSGANFNSFLSSGRKRWKNDRPLNTSTSSRRSPPVVTLGTRVLQLARCPAREG